MVSRRGPRLGFGTRGRGCFCRVGALTHRCWPRRCSPPAPACCGPSSRASPPASTPPSPSRSPRAAQTADQPQMQSSQSSCSQPTAGLLGAPRAVPTSTLARARIFQNLIQNLSGPRSGENFSKPQWVPACWLCITPIPMVPQPHFPSLRRSANADRFAKCPPSVLRAAQPRTQPRMRTYAVYPPLKLTALAKF